MTDVHPGPAAIRPLDIVPMARETGDRPFPQLLRSRRVLAGLTQQALADLSTISPRTIRDLEAGRANARAQTLQLLADALQLTGLVREIFVQAGRGGRSADPFGAGIVPAAPRPVSALLGREQEVRALASVLESGRSRMLSISGLPGVGKTRVATEIAAQLGSRRGWPVLWIGQDTRVRDGLGTVLSPLARSFHALTESSEKDISQAGRLIRQHDALLVLDGVADVRHPAGVEELLAYCPGIRIISTSRTPWQLAGLYAAVISPLATPDAGPDGEDPPLAFLGRVPAMRLLVDRLSEVRPGFELSVANASAAAEMCRKLDGLPVALEVAARQFRVLSLHQLAEVPVSDLLELTVKARPDGAPETIASLLRWSVERQEAAPRELLRELVSAERALTVTDMARALRRPLDKVVDDLGGLIGCGLVRALHGEATTALHVPNLLRAFLLSERPTGVLAERSRG